jgi:hypothetical protein
MVLDNCVEYGDRWPLYRKEGRAAGLAVSLSVPVCHGPQVLAALNLYSRAPALVHPGRAGPDTAFRQPRRRRGGHQLRMARQAKLTDDLQAALAGGR